LSSSARSKRIVLLLAAIVAAGVALAWALLAPRPRYTGEEWEKLGLAADATAGRIVFFAGGCDSFFATPSLQLARIFVSIVSVATLSPIGVGKAFASARPGQG
jgi:hypothetical protein